VSLPLRVLGGVGYSMIAAGGVISALSPNLSGYVLGFLLIVGFDKMFNVYMRTIRQRVIPPRDFGKTVGVITLLNNLSQPLAGLLVALLAAPLGTQQVILVLAGLTVLLGVVVLWWFAKMDRFTPADQADRASCDLAHPNKTDRAPVDTGEIPAGR
jgi:hypothetical protein